MSIRGGLRTPPLTHKHVNFIPTHARRVWSLRKPRKMLFDVQTQRLALRGPMSRNPARTPQNPAIHASGLPGGLSATQLIELPHDERVTTLESLQNPIERGLRPRSRSSLCWGGTAHEPAFFGAESCRAEFWSAIETRTQPIFIYSSWG